ncbi:MAG: hypothetical protein MZV70_48490 [Desulfobacterales bacterium]|nr:hypothetical protein [Desulfobacterales bacterium]
MTSSTSGSEPAQGGLHQVRPVRAPEIRHRRRDLHLPDPRQVQGLREVLPHLRHQLRGEGRRSATLKVGAVILVPGLQALRPVRLRLLRLRDASRTWSPAWSTSGCSPPSGPCMGHLVRPSDQHGAAPHRLDPVRRLAQHQPAATTATARASAACTPSRRRS